MHKTKAALTIALLLISSFPFIRKAEATPGEAKVYILKLSGVPGHWVNSCSLVKDGAIEACMLEGQYIHRNLPIAHPKRNVDYPPYYDATPYVVTGWTQYKHIVETYHEVILVNTHGEYLPMPSNYNPGEWVDEIADAMLNRRVTWVHVGGYPFYRVWYQENGTWEEWGETGFSHLMSYINKGDVNCWPPAPIEENEKINATMQLGVQQQIGISWQFQRVPGITCKLVDIDLATLGRPLKYQDFKEHLILPLFRHDNYYAAAAIAFAKAGSRHNSDGFGAYVHIGSRDLYDGQGNPIDADYGRGFVGTAAALWVLSMSFDAKLDAKQNTLAQPQNASLSVRPLISGLYEYDSDHLVTRLIFVIHGATQAPEGFPLEIDEVKFNVWDLSGQWINVTMRVDLGYSREGSGDGSQFTNLYNAAHAKKGLLPQALVWYGTAFLPPIAKFILWGLEGMMMFASWGGASTSRNGSGINVFESWIDFDYIPSVDSIYRNQRTYREFTTFSRLRSRFHTLTYPVGRLCP